ncbi:PH domain-containing protein [Thalassotalea aquiviva]|uniref:PH domain-containing protein n=1 Tax=Thalassotalea aquiviva TaxID=3242415 RepID=UPI00352A1EFF
MIEQQTAQANTEFSNQPIDTRQLPKIEQLDFQPLSKKFAPTNRLLNLISILLIAVAILGLLYQPIIPIAKGIDNILHWILWLLCSLGILFTYLLYLADLKKSYALREQDISFRSGLIFEKTVSQPILRVQHVELRRGPIDRKIGLANLQVFSAGGALHTFEIPGLEYQTAEDIRQFILSHKDVNEQG